MDPHINELFVCPLVQGHLRHGRGIAGVIKGSTKNGYTTFWIDKANQVIKVSLSFIGSGDNSAVLIDDHIVGTDTHFHRLDQCWRDETAIVVASDSSVNMKPSRVGVIFSGYKKQSPTHLDIRKSVLECNRKVRHSHIGKVLEIRYSNKTKLAPAIKDHLNAIIVAAFECAKAISVTESKRQS